MGRVFVEGSRQVRSIAFVVLMVALSCAGAAHAGVKVVEKIEYYRISGDTGDALMSAMDRYGPRHGFLTRAIAQTRYSIAWSLEWAATDDRCQLERADVTLSVNYRFPSVAGSVSPQLKRRWAAFIKGVNKHERMHGRIAHDMADAAHKAAMKLRVDDDPTCHKAKQELSRLVHEVYARYEARQQSFDALEHQPGGNVDRLVSSLTRKR
jgi:predicted secreted Zn-dependent protease